MYSLVNLLFYENIAHFLKLYFLYDFKKLQTLHYQTVPWVIFSNCKSNKKMFGVTVTVIIQLDS